MIKLKSLLTENLKSVKSVDDAVLRQIADAAQNIYDDWEQDEHGDAGDLGTGGICHLIADELALVLSDNGIDASSVCSSFEQHVYLICKFKEGVFTIDIPWRTYETGGGYSWKKLPDIKFDASHVEIDQIDKNPENFNQYVEDAENYDA